MKQAPEGLILDIEGQRLLRNGERIHLSKKPLAMLAYFAKNEGALLTVDQILDNVWPDRIVSRHSVKDYVAAIRRALNDNANSPQYIGQL